MQFYFIRHAQSADNLFVAENADKGVRSHGLDQSWLYRQADPELSEIGRRQAQILREFLAKKKALKSDTPTGQGPYGDNLSFTHIYSSLMVRAMETANAIGNALNMTPAVWEDLHETGGFWEPDAETGKPVGSSGKNRTYFEKRYPNFVLPDRLGKQGWWDRPLETTEECRERGQRFFHDLMGRHGHTEDRVAVVGHGLFYNFMLKAFLKIPRKSGVIFAINNVAITRIDFVENSVRVIYQNRSDFLPPDLIT